MKNVLIIGAGGFIGKHLAKNLSSAFNVHGISKRGGEGNSSVDLLDKGALHTFLENKTFDVVLNLACIMAKPGNLKDGNILAENLKLSMNTAEVLAELPSMHIINFSSSSVYANNNTSCDETSCIDPSQNNDCFYGLAKFNAEMIFTYLLSGSHPLTHLRIPMVYGEGMDATRIHSVFSSELREKNRITVFGEGKRTISHIAVEELCDKVRQVIGKKITGTYNVGGSSISMLRLAEETIAREGNTGSRIELVKGGSTQQFIFNGSKLDRELAS